VKAILPERSIKRAAVRCTRGGDPRRAAGRGAPRGTRYALFSEAERAWLDGLASRLRGEGFDLFVPHEQFELSEVTAVEVMPNV
jgi:hypothetical protein